MQSNILIVEDDLSIKELVESNIRSLGYGVVHAADGELGVELALGNDFALIVLDINLPKLDGIEVCQQVRNKNLNVPILMLSARGGEIDRVRGLELGADDYLTKPFSVHELKARVKALLRRAERMAPKAAQPEVGGEEQLLCFPGLEIDTLKRKVMLSGEAIALTPKEFDLLAFMALRPGVPYSRSQLLENVWEVSCESYESNVNSTINRLRQKLSENNAAKQYIQTVRGIGYCFADLSEDESESM